MGHRSYYLALTGLALLLSSPSLATDAHKHSAAQLSPNSALVLIYRQQYNEAINQLEQILEAQPGNAEALTYMATANLYQARDFGRAQKVFEAAFKAGGGATFFVNHSHESLTTTDVVDYCRGWLHLRRGVIEFVPVEGSHGFKLNLSQVQEFKRNRLTKKAFHIKFEEKNQNFRGRTNTDVEALLIVALYNNFARN